MDIVITHAFFPVVNAAKKADEDGIPLFGWADDGWLTMSNTPTVEVADVVQPDPELTERYEQKYQLFKKIYPACRELFTQMA